MFPAHATPPDMGTIVKTNSYSAMDGSKKSNEAPVLFAVPAPGSVGKGLLCLCRKVYWTSGLLMHCAYAPVTKEEAAKLLKDPSVISILSNPVNGSNLLTVAANGAIIGVQQTVGYLHPQSTSQNHATRKLTEQKSLTVATTSGGAPDEAQKVPTQAAALPQPTATHQSAEQRSLALPPALPKIDAVFTLAESGIHVTPLKEQVPYSKISSANVPNKEASIHTPSASLTSRVLPPNIPKKEGPIIQSASFYLQHNVPSASVLKEEAVIQLSSTGHPNKAPVGNKTFAASSAQESLVSNSGAAPSQSQQLSTNLPRLPQNVSISEFTRRINLQPVTLSKDQKESKSATADKELPLDLTAPRIQRPVTEQSNVLSDLLNKVNENKQGTTHSGTDTERLLKRKADGDKSDSATEKRRKVTTTATNHPALKVKFSWNNHGSLESVTSKPTASSDKPDVPKRQNRAVPSKVVDTRRSAAEKKPTHFEVETAYGTIVINNPQDLRYKSDAKQTVVSLGGKLPVVTAQKKLKVGDLKSLGCQPSCPLLQDIARKERKAVATKQPVHHTVPISLDALTRHPDFNHIPTVDKVTYLKELLRMQRAALGISI